jgi:hypothetical protein
MWNLFSIFHICSEIFVLVLLCFMIIINSAVVSLHFDRVITRALLRWTQMNMNRLFILIQQFRSTYDILNIIMHHE